MDCSPPGPSVHGILQARILEWVAMSSSRGSSQIRDQTQVSCMAGGFLTIWATREAQENHRSPQIIHLLCFLKDNGPVSMYACVFSGFSCVHSCDPMDCSPAGSSVHGILQARILEWVAAPSSRGSSWPRDQTHVSCIAGGFFLLSHRGSPSSMNTAAYT